MEALEMLMDDVLDVPQRHAIHNLIASLIVYFPSAPSSGFLCLSPQTRLRDSYTPASSNPACEPDGGICRDARDFIRRVVSLARSYRRFNWYSSSSVSISGPKDLPILARTAGRLSGRAIGYVQMARGQFESVMQQTQARQVHKELQDTIAQLEAIKHEIRTISFMNPGPLTTRLVDNINNIPAAGADIVETGPEKPDNEEGTTVTITPKDQDPKASTSSNMHSQATAYAKLAEITSANVGSVNSEALNELIDESGNLVLPVSAKSAGLLPDHKDITEFSLVIFHPFLKLK
nr:sec-independent protein translocase protein TatB [Ipomoea batatas]GME09580.1 sec-independent protein translocase protein TatB [Ipomoea batatas]